MTCKTHSLPLGKISNVIIRAIGIFIGEEVYLSDGCSKILDFSKQNTMQSGENTSLHNPRPTWNLRERWDRFLEYPDEVWNSCLSGLLCLMEQDNTKKQCFLLQLEIRDYMYPKLSPFPALRLCQRHANSLSPCDSICKVGILISTLPILLRGVNEIQNKSFRNSIICPRTFIVFTRHYWTSA